MDALKMAIARRRPGEGEVIFHSDRVSQYTGRAFRELYFSNDIIPSVGYLCHLPNMRLELTKLPLRRHRTVYEIGRPPLPWLWSRAWSPPRPSVML